MHIAQLPYGLVEEQLAHRTNLPACLKHIVEEIQVAPYKHHRAAIHQHQRRISQLLILQDRGRGLVKPLAEASMEADADAYGERALIAQLLWCRA
jgi:hypothetical protein